MVFRKKGIEDMNRMSTGSGHVNVDRMEAPINKHDLKGGVEVKVPDMDIFKQLDESRKGKEAKL